MAIFVPDLAGGGAERMMVNLAGEFQRAGRSVDLVLARARGAYLDLVPAGVGIVDLRARRVLTSLPALTRYLRRRRPAALLAAMDHANLVALWAGALSGARPRVVVSVRNVISRDLETIAGPGRFLLPFLVRACYPRAAGIVAVSQGAADDLARVTGIAREKISVIYNPVLVESLFARAREAPGHPWFGDGGAPVLLGVGRLTRQKDFALLLRAFALVQSRRPCRLVILGEGEERGRLEALATELGVAESVSLPGFVANPYACMAGCAVFVLSSAWEGLPGVLVEALACGAKVVATDCPSGPREILMGGRHGELVPVGDVAALAAAIERALGAPPPGDREEALLPFRPAEVARQYLSLLDPGSREDRR